jgi:hypothetical protein
MAYVSDAELSDYLRNTIVADEVEIASALAAAENSVNSYCQRTFVVPTAATTRTFVGCQSYVLDVPDIANTTDLVILDDGSAVPSTDYQLEISPNTIGPVGVDGRTWPYTRIRRIAGYWDIDTDREATISITARWGWPAIPAEVEMATKLLARDYLLARDTGFGIVQVGDFSRRVAANGVVVDLLSPLRRAEAWGIA